MNTMLLVTMGSVILAAVTSAVAWRSVAGERRRSEARVRALAAEVAHTDLFAALPASRTPRAPNRAAAIAAAVFVVAGAAALAAALAGSSSGGSRAESRGVAPPAATPKPLELLALGHERDGDRLIVRGVVHNPSDAGTVKQLIPVVFVFDHNGGFVTSGRGTVATATLGPGADSTFVVAMPEVADVGRYRVSFTTDDRVVAHVDRRSETRN